MSLHKLTAGSGYDYLTRQVAALDATDKGHVALASYYTEKGESPGVWVGAGMRSLDGLEAGDPVTADHMQNLFGAGHHPLATERTRALDQRVGRPGQPSPTSTDYKAAARLGTPFKVYDNDVSPFRIEVARRIEAFNRAAGLGSADAVPAAERARIRTEVATEMFRAEHGRDPADARELAATIAKHSRPRTNAVAGYDLTFSPVKSVSVLWAVADPQTAAVIEHAHQAAIGDALAFLEAKAVFTRRGANGVRQVDVEGLIATAFTHRDSRAGDPDLHTHVAGTVALQALGRDRYREAKVAGNRVSLSSWRSPYLIAPTAQWFDRFAAAEAITQRYLNSTYVADVSGAVRQPALDPHRVSRAIAGWDIQAHRVLSKSTSAADYVAVSRTHAFVADAGAHLAAAAALETADPDIAPPRDGRRAGALQELQRAWANVASRWGDLRLPSDKPDPRLQRAADELSAALRELTHGATAPLPLADIAQQPTLGRALISMMAFTETSSELAHVMLEKAQRGGLVGPARALSRRAHNDVEAGLVTPSPPGDVVWVSAADIHAKRLVPLPAPVAECLDRASRDCVTAATRAFSILSVVSPSTQTRETGTEGTPPSHSTQERERLRPALAAGNASRTR